MHYHGKRQRLQRKSRQRANLGEKSATLINEKSVRGYKEIDVAT